MVTLVLIRGSNLDALVNHSVNLTDRGLQRHRIVWVREMDEAELRAAGRGSRPSTASRSSSSPRKRSKTTGSRRTRRGLCANPAVISFLLTILGYA